MKDKLRKVMIVKGELKSKTGYFHGFFQYGDADSQCSYAVIELENGEVRDVDTESIKFINIKEKKQVKTSSIENHKCSNCKGAGEVWNHMLGGYEGCKHCCGICGKEITVTDFRCDNCGRIICDECRAGALHGYDLCKECFNEGGIENV